MGLFENFPYTNFHDLNLDWIISVVKDFFNKYNHIEELIEQGKQEITGLTNEEVERLRAVANDLEQLMQQYYETYSADIADKLAEAIASLNTSLGNAQNSFDQHVDTKAANTIASIPADYTELSNSVNQIYNTLQAFSTSYADPNIWEKGGLGDSGENNNYRIECRARNISFIKFDRGITITTLNGTNAQCAVHIKNPDGTQSYVGWGQSRTIEPGTMARIVLDDQFNSTTPTNHTLEQILSSFRITSIVAPLEEMVQSYPSTLTNSQLQTMGVDHVANLPKNRFYYLNNVTINGLPDDIATPVNGCLACFTSQINGWNMYILTTNSGLTRYGTSVGTDMRWDSGNKLERYQYLITDGRLEVLGVTNIRDMPKNKIYSLMNVSVLQDLPAGADNPINGFLICMQTAVNGWPGYVLITNNGTTYTGTSLGAATRWEYAHNSLTNQISGMVGKKVVLVGDSIAYGSHMSDAGQGTRTVITIRGTEIKENTSTIVWTKGFLDYIRLSYDCQVLNQSFPGCSFNDVSNNLSTLIPAEYDYAIIVLGVNDWENPVTVKTHIQTISLYCRSNKIIPIFVTPYPARAYVNQLAKIRLYIMSYQNEVADFYTNFIEYLDFKGINLAAIMDDTVHYTDSAQPYILECMKRALHL